MNIVLEVSCMKYILMRLKEVQDPRQLGKIKHVLSDILAMCIISIMCGAKSTHQIHMFVQCREEWFRRFLELLERYIQIVTDFSKMKLIIFVNLHSLLSPDELVQLYQSARYRKARLLLLESRLPSNEHASEQPGHVHESI